MAFRGTVGFAVWPSSQDGLSAGHCNCRPRYLARQRIGENDVCGSQLGCPGRLIGTCLPNFATASSGIVEGMSGVQIGPGATVLARIPFSASNCHHS
jgi:hypothetical protein